MSSDLEITPAVERALRAAFGTAELDSARPMGGGLSGAHVFKIRVGGVPYLLRVEAERDAFRDPARAYACMRIAADAFLAPRVRYADADDGLAIMDFIEEKSLTFDYRGSREDLVVEATQTVRALHAGPAFPPLVDYLDGMDALISIFRARGLFTPKATARVFQLYSRLRGGYRPGQGDLVASHNDLNPRNILFDGQRLWLVDWESAFLADRYVDLACIANLFAHTEEEEELLLRTYFGEVDAAARARLFLMRQVNHLFYAVGLANSVAEATGPVESLEGPDLAQLHMGVTLGEVDLGSAPARLDYARARLAAAQEGMGSARFAAALATLG